MQQTGIQMALFFGSLVLFSWPFWSAPESRGIGFVFSYFFGVWGFLVLVLLVFERRTKTTTSGRRSGGDLPEDHV